MCKMQNLCPNNFDLQKLNEELTCMAMMCALLEDYTNFTSSILLLGTLDETKLQNTFHAKETNCQHHTVCMLLYIGVQEGLFI